MVREQMGPGYAGIDWGQLRHWQTVDPVPWWILDHEKLEQILVVQIDGMIAQQKLQLDQLQKVRAIVAGQKAK